MTKSNKSLDSDLTPEEEEGIWNHYEDYVKTPVNIVDPLEKKWFQEFNNSKVFKRNPADVVRRNAPFNLPGA